MTEWIDDPWIEFGCEIAEEFFSNHRETMPEDPHDIWDGNEVSYFCFAFALWAAQSKFKLKKGAAFNDRELQYRANVSSAIAASSQIEGNDTDKSSYDTYKIREQEYISILMKGSSSLFGAISGSPFKKACKPFVSHACRRYIYSKNDLEKIVNPWLIEKGSDFDKKINFT